MTLPTGHGWVRINLGVVARCGGPHICSECAAEMEHLARAVKELYFWQYGTNPTNFTTVLYTLFSKADPSNQYKLSLGFPWEYEAFKQWNDSPDAEAFFAKFGFGSTSSPTKT